MRYSRREINSVYFYTKRVSLEQLVREASDICSQSNNKNRLFKAAKTLIARQRLLREAREAEVILFAG